jgi:hypothetical protein
MKTNKLKDSKNDVEGVNVKEEREQEETEGEEVCGRGRRYGFGMLKPSLQKLKILITAVRYLLARGG